MGVWEPSLQPLQHDFKTNAIFSLGSRVPLVLKEKNTVVSRNTATTEASRCALLTGLEAGHSPQYCDDNPHGSAELCKRTRCRQFLICFGGKYPQMSNHGEGFLFRVLESTNQQQEIFLLINQSFSEALRSQIVQVQFFHLREDGVRIRENKDRVLTDPALYTAMVSCPNGSVIHKSHAHL